MNYEYTIKRSRYGLYTSYLSDGTAMVTGLTEDACRLVTDTIHIPVLKGEFDGWTSIMGKAVVDGKAVNVERFAGDNKIMQLMAQQLKQNEATMKSRQSEALQRTPTSSVLAMLRLLGYLMPLCSYRRRRRLLERK